MPPKIEIRKVQIIGNFFTRLIYRHKQQDSQFESFMRTDGHDNSADDMSIREAFIENGTHTSILNKDHEAAGKIFISTYFSTYPAMLTHPYFIQ